MIRKCSRIFLCAPSNEIFAPTRRLNLSPPNTPHLLAFAIALRRDRTVADGKDRRTASLIIQWGIVSKNRGSGTSFP